MRHAHFLESLLHRLLAFRARHAAIRQRQFHVLENRQVADQVKRLEDETDFPVADTSPFAQIELLNGNPVQKLDLGERARIRNREIGFIFQAFNLIGDLTVFENVELPLTYRGMPGAERKKAVQEALEKVGMAHRVKHYPSQLSGGQQQRVAVARALVGRPLILLADEPTGNLDSQNGEAVIELLSELHRSGATICMVTHDQRYSKFADRTINLFDGRIVDEAAAGSATTH